MNYNIRHYLLECINKPLYDIDKTPIFEHYYKKNLEKSIINLESKNRDYLIHLKKYNFKDKYLQGFIENTKKIFKNCLL